VGNFRLILSPSTHSFEGGFVSGGLSTSSGGGHIVELYGVDLDADGIPISYYVKDSYEPYFYVADANSAHRNGFEVSTVTDLAE
jgi:hypothetical protein